MKTMILLVTILVSSQAFGSSLDDALKAAIGTAQQDHENTQVSLKVSPDQIVKAKFSRVNDGVTIDLDKLAAEDRDNKAADEEEVYEVEQELAGKPELKSVKQLGDI